MILYILLNPDKEGKLYNFKGYDYAFRNEPFFIGIVKCDSEINDLINLHERFKYCIQGSKELLKFINSLKIENKDPIILKQFEGSEDDCKIIFTYIRNAVGLSCFNKGPLLNSDNTFKEEFCWSSVVKRGKKKKIEYDTVELEEYYKKIKSKDKKNTHRRSCVRTGNVSKEKYCVTPEGKHIIIKNITAYFKATTGKPYCFDLRHTKKFTLNTWKGCDLKDKDKYLKLWEEYLIKKFTPFWFVTLPSGETKYFDNRSDLLPYCKQFKISAGFKFHRIYYKQNSYSFDGYTVGRYLDEKIPDETYKRAKDYLYNRVDNSKIEYIDGAEEWKKRAKIIK